MTAKRCRTPLFLWFGHLVSEASPNGNATIYGFNPASGLVTAADPLGKVTTTVRDMAGRPVRAVDRLGRVTDSGGSPINELGFFPTPPTPAMATPPAVSPCWEALCSTVPDFDVMSVSLRREWLTFSTEGFAADYNVETWFNNIAEVLRFFDEKDLAGRGSWASIVDGNILQGIQFGMAEWRGIERVEYNVGTMTAPFGPAGYFAQDDVKRRLLDEMDPRNPSASYDNARRLWQLPTESHSVVRFFL